MKGLLALTFLTTLASGVSVQRPRLVIDDFKCPSGHLEVSNVPTSGRLSKEVYNQISSAVISSLPSDAEGRGDFAGCAVRLAAHDFLDYRSKGKKLFGTSIGGMDGCFDQGVAENAGLSDCTPILGEVFKEFCDKVSLPDFIVIQAEALMARTSDCEASLQGKFQQNFKFGRKFCGKEGNQALVHQLQAIAHPLNRTRKNKPITFSEGTEGLNDLKDHLFRNEHRKHELAVALLGAHTLGRVTQAQLAGGRTGWWDSVKRQQKFDNSYYKSLVNKGWAVEKGQTSNASFARSDRKRHYVDKDDVCVDQIALRIDLALVWNNIDERSNCCAYVDKGNFSFSRALPKKGACLTKKKCCAEVGNALQCEIHEKGKDIVFQYAKNNTFWIDKFLVAWKIATENGMGGGFQWKGVNALQVSRSYGSSSSSSYNGSHRNGSHSWCPKIGSFRAVRERSLLSLRGRSVGKRGLQEKKKSSSTFLNILNAFGTAFVNHDKKKCKKEYYKKFNIATQNAYHSTPKPQTPSYHPPTPPPHYHIYVGNRTTTKKPWSPGNPYFYKGGAFSALFKKTKNPKKLFEEE